MVKRSRIGPLQRVLLDLLREHGTSKTAALIGGARRERGDVAGQSVSTALRALETKGLVDQPKYGWWELSKTERLKKFSPAVLRDQVVPGWIQPGTELTEEQFHRLLRTAVEEADALVTMGPFKENSDPLAIALVLGFTHLEHAWILFKKRYGDRLRLRHQPSAGQFGGPGDGNEEQGRDQRGLSGRDARPSEAAEAEAEGSKGQVGHHPQEHHRHDSEPEEEGSPVGAPTQYS